MDITCPSHHRASPAPPGPCPPPTVTAHAPQSPGGRRSPQPDLPNRSHIGRWSGSAARRSGRPKPPPPRAGIDCPQRRRRPDHPAALAGHPPDRGAWPRFPDVFRDSPSSTTRRSPFLRLPTPACSTSPRPGFPSVANEVCPYAAELCLRPHRTSDGSADNCRRKQALRLRDRHQDPPASGPTLRHRLRRANPLPAADVRT